MRDFFLSKIKDGKLEETPYTRDFMKKHEGQTARIEVVKASPSEELRGFYYAAVLPTVKATVPEWKKLSNDDVHEVLKKIFNGFNFFNPVTKRTERVGRTAMSSQSSYDRAMEFIEKIGAWLAEEYFVELPNPEEYKDRRDTLQL